MFTTTPSEDGAVTDDAAREAHIAALLRERDGYLARGLLDRVEGVDDALVAEGFERVERAVQTPKASRATRK